MTVLDYKHSKAIRIAIDITYDHIRSNMVDLLIMEDVKRHNYINEFVSDLISGYGIYYAQSSDTAVDISDVEKEIGRYISEMAETYFLQLKVQLQGMLAVDRVKPNSQGEPVGAPAPIPANVGPSSPENFYQEPTERTEPSPELPAEQQKSYVSSAGALGV